MKSHVVSTLAECWMWNAEPWSLTEVLLWHRAICWTFDDINTLACINKRIIHPVFMLLHKCFTYSQELAGVDLARHSHKNWGIETFMEVCLGGISFCGCFPYDSLSWVISGPINRLTLITGNLFMGSIKGHITHWICWLICWFIFQLVKSKLVVRF